MSKKVDPKLATKVRSAIPKKRQELLKWDGWGYNDSKLYIQNGVAHFSGNRYPIGGDVALPGIRKFIRESVGVDLDVCRTSDVKPMPTTYPEAVLNEEFLHDVKKMKIDLSLEGEDRLIRCHGQTLFEVYAVRQGSYTRIPDIVLWPVSHDEVVKIVKLANELNVVVIPFGGGTSVSGSITCPQDEPRCICVLDTSQMNRMLWLDKENLVVCFESGIVGQDLERVLRAEGLTLGHEPDSYEFSTLGGWVATRASGMKKNVYGNIEDLVVQVKMVTTKGVLERNITAPRVSCGPDFNQIILGSEGTLGVVTEVILKVRPLPRVKKYGSLVFTNFESGIRFLREIAKRRCQPASIRLMDNEQFAFGQALNLYHGLFASFLESLKKFVLTKVKGYDLNKLAVATLVFEGDEEAINLQEKLVFEIAGRHSGFSAGATNGEKGYILTYVIAYIRDFALDIGVVAESFETSVPWDKCEKLCYNVKATVRKECEKYGINHFLISCRVTQSYDAGACVYFYFGFKITPQHNPSHLYEEIENKARDEILDSGGSISHHHGIGKIRARWYKQTVSDVGVGLYKTAKIELDPKNIFAAGNFLMPEDQIDFNNLPSKL